VILPQPEIKFISNRVVILPENYYVQIGNRLITIMAGFKTDGASIPRVAWWFATPFQGTSLPAAVVHDALYQSEFYPREICDEIFRDLLKANGMGAAKTWLFYHAVSSFGWMVWRNHTRRAVTDAAKYVTVQWVGGRSAV
jgi:hypothetical protein